MPGAGEALDHRTFNNSFGGDGNTGEDDQVESLADKIKGGEYADMVKAATAGNEAQLCLGPGGAITKQSPHTAFTGMNVNPTSQENRDDELRRLRQQRMAQMQAEQGWRQQGHGSLRELSNEREFIEVIQPHERAVVLLDDDSTGCQEEVRQVLSRLSQTHLEAQFCRLRVDRAAFLTRMVELDGLPAILVLRRGEVTRLLSPEDDLFQYSSASSPLFRGHLSRLLRRVGALTDEGGGSSDEGEEGHDDVRRNRRRNKDL